jgi:phage baseplate assembly protein W
MAFGAKKIYPLDTKPSTGIGIALPFNAPGVFKTTYTTKDTIKYDLINFFLTNKNERYLNPTFGGNLRAFIFQQISAGNIDSLKEDIQQQLSVYFPMVIIGSLDIDSLPEFNQINVVLKYNIADTGLTDTVQLAFT